MRGRERAYVRSLERHDLSSKRTVGPIIAISVYIRTVYVDEDRLPTYSKLNVWNFTLVASRLIKFYTPSYYAFACRRGTQDLRNSAKSSTSLSFNIRVKLFFGILL